jgi:hypothetical protein
MANKYKNNRRHAGYFCVPGPLAPVWLAIRSAAGICCWDKETPPERVALAALIISYNLSLIAK